MPNAEEQRTYESPVSSGLRALMMDLHCAEFQESQLVETRNGRHPGCYSSEEALEISMDKIVKRAPGLKSSPLNYWLFQGVTTIRLTLLPRASHGAE